MIQFQVTLTAVSVATSFLEPLYTTLEFSPLQLRTSKELILILVQLWIQLKSFEILTFVQMS